MNNVAIITGFGWAGISVPIAMTVEYLVKNGYLVDIYLDKNSFCENIGLNQAFFEYENANVIFLDENKNNIYCNYNGINIDVSESDIDATLVISKKRYDWVIGFDPNGVVRAGLYAYLNNIPFIYFSLEIYEKNDSLKTAEIFFSKRAEAIFIQDLYRAEILAELLDVPVNKFKVVYNTTRGNVIEHKDNYFREKFTIPKDKLIVLVVGTLLEITGIDKILEVLEFWGNNYVLVMHGWTTDRNIQEKINMALKKFPDFFFYSEEIISHSEKMKIFSSADIGLVYYEPINLNLKYAAWSSGKFFDFARCGVPVIANEIPNMRQLVEVNKCGIVLNDFGKYHKAFEKITNNYSSFQQGCFNTFKQYDFNSSFSNAINEIEQMVDVID